MDTNSVDLVSLVDKLNQCYVANKQDFYCLDLVDHPGGYYSTVNKSGDVVHSVQTKEEMTKTLNEELLLQVSISVIDGVF
jgi:hypothetical protein